MVSIKSTNDIAKIREGAILLAEIMDKIEEVVVPGKNTFEIDQLAEKLILGVGGVPAFKGYGEVGNPFPATICASVNNEVVHGIPSKKVILKEGDLFKVDIGMKYKGFFTDMARTFAVGKISPEAQKLLDATAQSFWEGISQMKNGKLLSGYSKAVQKYAEGQGFSVVRNLVGHGVGKKLHEDPQVPNYYNKNYADLRLKSGMVLALEPMINAGGFETRIGADGWTFITLDGSLSAHYENTILITDTGVEVLTVIAEE
jgi:methionyl aminopeptidase